MIVSTLPSLANYQLITSRHLCSRSGKHGLVQIKMQSFSNEFNARLAQLYMQVCSFNVGPSFMA